MSGERGDSAQMSERCQICGHSPASHQNWGSDGCEARSGNGDYCRCVQYLHAQASR